MAISTINRLITIFDGAFRALSAPVSMAETERLAMLVHHAMESPTRAYHTAGHVFAMCEGMNPLQTLAALFHDLVYYQLDAGFPRNTGDALQGVTRVEAGALILLPIAVDDTQLALCAGLFGFAPGQTLPLYGGMNEFLSAVVAARRLHTCLQAADLIAVLACIEATIPFRHADAQGRSAAQRLALRVQEQARPLFAKGDAMALDAYVKRVVTDAVVLTNRDVSSFAEADPGLFLSSTWLLIEESNAPLAIPGMYTLQEYRRGLTRMDGFLRNLNPNHIFQHYNGHPSNQEIVDLGAAAARNITFAVDFLGAKITSIAIVEALALCTGTDGPISMFLGEIRSAYGRPDRVEDFLPTAPSLQNGNAELLRAFEKGRTLESTNDLTTSPITAFIYRCIGHAGTLQALDQSKKMFDGELEPLAFLQSLDRDMVRAIIGACSRIALSRSEALRRLEQAL